MKLLEAEPAHAPEAAPQAPLESPPEQPASAPAAGLDGEAVRDVRVLEHFSFLSVPLSDAARVVDAVNGTPVNGTTLRLEIARS